jgi:hypothetical protein
MADHYHYVTLRLTSSEHPLDEPDPLGDGRVELLVDGRTLAAEVVSTTCDATPRTSP